MFAMTEKHRESLQDLIWVGFFFNFFIPLVLTATRQHKTFAEWQSLSEDFMPLDSKASDQCYLKDRLISLSVLVSLKRSPQLPALLIVFSEFAGPDRLMPSYITRNTRQVHL